MDVNSASSALMGLAVAFALVLIVGTGMGALIGTLGGLIGRKKAKKPMGNPMCESESSQQEIQVYSVQQQ